MDPETNTAAEVTAPAATPEQAAPATTTETTTTTTEPTTVEATSTQKFNVAPIIGVVVVLVILIALLSRKKKGCGCGCDKNDASDASGTPPVEIYVGNLSYDMTEAQFRKEFERFGVVKSARIIGHRSGKSKGYGFVEMPHRKEAMIAIKNLHNHEVMGRKLRVNEARRGFENAASAKQR